MHFRGGGLHLDGVASRLSCFLKVSCSLHTRDTVWDDREATTPLFEDAEF